jgi:hypothetical protein
LKYLRIFTSKKASPAGPMPEGADGSAFYRDGTCGAGGAGPFLRVSRRLPAGSPLCRTGAGSSAGLRVSGSLHAGRICERHCSRRTSGTDYGAGSSAGPLDSQRRPSCRPVGSAAPPYCWFFETRHTAGAQWHAVLSAGLCRQYYTD